MFSIDYKLTGSYDTMNGVDEKLEDEDLPKNCLPPDDIIEKYRDAIVHYAKVTFLIHP